MATSPAVTTVRNLVRKAKAISPTWGYFGLRADLEGRVLKSTADCPVCKTCFKPVSSKGGSELMQHGRYMTGVLIGVSYKLVTYSYTCNF